MDDLQHKIITLSDGQQVLVQDLPGITIAVEVDEVTVVSEQIIKVGQAEFEDLAEKAMTHELEVDTMTGKVSINSKDTDEMPKIQQESIKQ